MYGYFNIQGWDKDYSTQNETAIPNISVLLKILRITVKNCRKMA